MTASRTHPFVLGLVALGVALVTAALSAKGAQASSPSTLYVPLATGVGAAAVFLLVRHIEPAYTLTAGLALSVFSGNWTRLGLPFGIDRLILAAGVLVVLLEALSRRDHQRFRLRPVHWLLLAASLYALVSAVVVGTVGDQEVIFELTDKYGFIPFLLFCAAPVAFASERQRGLLLTGMVALGAYLGLMAVLQGIGADALVFPKYIIDPSIGIHQDRARGPFLEAGANGHALFVCAVACAVAAGSWKRKEWRLTAAGVGALCVVGVVFTLTRQVWLAAAVASAITLVVVPSLRRYLVPAGVCSVVGVLGLLAFVPGLSGQADERFGNQRAVWDRLNSDHAALNMLAERPLTGFGWSAFEESSEKYYSLAESYPLTQIDEVHSVFLSNLAELGLIGTSLWLAALLAGFGGAIRRRGPPADLELWRAGFLAVAISWLVVANFTPFSYAFSNYAVWLWAGVLFAGHVPRARSATPAAAHAAAR